eukprot:gnl/TRDRNA2_/TRDRNA2_157486_c0_seq2.p1 gnl/TRDRNA2_/TRDRNA2_157486_c0~~gnl/TRDRNA2_/TRDRNA2_157486_c0_seq2.p1  ORF type:complete len:532 (+),score=53.72 gnl/TRDRNA2_/TRDRNA2_157486_c0_seq2:503-2098(+)
MRTKCCSFRLEELKKPKGLGVTWQDDDRRQRGGCTTCGKQLLSSTAPVGISWHSKGGNSFARRSFSGSSKWRSTPPKMSCESQRASCEDGSGPSDPELTPLRACAAAEKLVIEEKARRLEEARSGQLEYPADDISAGGGFRQDVVAKGVDVSSEGAQYPVLSATGDVIKHSLPWVRCSMRLLKASAQPGFIEFWHTLTFAHNLYCFWPCPELAWGSAVLAGPVLFFAMRPLLNGCTGDDAGVWHCISSLAEDLEINAKELDTWDVPMRRGLLFAGPSMCSLLVMLFVLWPLVHFSSFSESLGPFVSIGDSMTSPRTVTYFSLCSVVWLSSGFLYWQPAIAQLSVMQRLHSTLLRDRIRQWRLEVRGLVAQDLPQAVSLAHLEELELAVRGRLREFDAVWASPVALISASLAIIGCVFLGVVVQNPTASQTVVRAIFSLFIVWDLVFLLLLLKSVAAVADTWDREVEELDTPLFRSWSRFCTGADYCDCLRRLDGMGIIFAGLRITGRAVLGVIMGASLLVIASVAAIMHTP